jgi:fructose/tagatose bisphosphate aldolase
MPLESAVELLEHARRHQYAVGYFESWDGASLEGVMDAAEQSAAPIIAGFNGAFLAQSERLSPARLDWYAALGRAAAESARVPCALMFNECPQDAWVARAGEVGFNLVMLADADAGGGEIVRRVAELVRLVHPRGVAVEAESGELPCGAVEHGCTAGTPTDPEQAAAFVEATGVDMLAVSSGNVHVLLDGQRSLDLARLAAIRAKVEVPLVLHGGSGIANDSLARAIAIGVAKVNYGTYLKQRCVTAIRQALANAGPDPHHLLGGGGDGDLVVVVRRAVREAVLERIGLLKCCGRAG